jgi:nitrogenase molybdenum-iron protein alpha/beta subunit
MYTAWKARLPFLDINQEREHAYAGYQGIITLARHPSATGRGHAFAARRGWRGSDKAGGRG